MAKLGGVTHWVEPKDKSGGKKKAWPKKHKLIG